MACGTALAVALTVSLPQAAHADQVITPPPVPDTIKVPEGSRAFFLGHGVGTQNYVCLPSGTGFKFTLFTPQATLFDRYHRELTTHYFSPNPDPKDNGAIRATWQHSRDTSTVWAKATGTSTDENFVAPGAVAWVRLEVVGARKGPNGGKTLTPAKFIQRLNTAGGLAPSTGCASAADVGTQAFMPYTADYFFFLGPEDGDDVNP
jgi:hypothetical protein